MSRCDTHAKTSWMKSFIFAAYRMSLQPAVRPVLLLLFSSHSPIGPQPYPVLYVVVNPVRGLLDRKRSEEHLPSSNESKITQTNKNDKEKRTRVAKNTCQKKIDDGHSIERVWHRASREPSDTLPGSQPCTQTCSIYHISYSPGFSFHLWKLYSILMCYLPKPLFVYVLMVLISIVELHS